MEITLNIRSMEVFCAVVRRGVMVRAADDLKMTPAAVSRSVAELESYLGKKLINRTTRKLSVSPEGQEYFQQASRILDEFNQLHERGPGRSDLVRGQLKIAAPISYGLSHLAPQIDRFKNRAPDVSIDLHLTDSVVDLVENGFDLAIRIQRQIKDSSLVGKKIAVFTHHIVAHPDLVSQFGLPQKVSDLKKFPCIANSGVATPGKWTLEHRGKTYTHSFEPEISVNSSSFLIQLAMNGRGACMVPSFLLADHLRRKKLEELLPQYRKPTATCWLVYPGRKFQRPVVQAFIEHFATEYEREASS
jgi:DNA-binding transcriptional LysR family regulator